jgi:DNA-directed RNA polymerase subunit RPC12/RpoP
MELLYVLGAIIGLILGLNRLLRFIRETFPKSQEKAPSCEFSSKTDDIKASAESLTASLEDKKVVCDKCGSSSLEYNSHYHEYVCWKCGSRLKNNERNKDQSLIKDLLRKMSKY